MQPRDAEPKARRHVSAWVKLFVAHHLVAITSWSLPRPPEDLRTGKRTLGLRTENPRRFLYSVGNIASDGLLLFNDAHLRPSPIKFYTLGTGFWQYWDMFAPNPASSDYYGTAEVTYRDGTVRAYRYPRMYELGLGEKYLKERYRKFFERAHLDANSYQWPVFAQRVALLSYTDPQNPPVTVKLTRHWQEIAPPGKLQNPEYSHYTYYTHTVDASALADATGWGR